MFVYIFEDPSVIDFNKVIIPACPETAAKDFFLSISKLVFFHNLMTILPIYPVLLSLDHLCSLLVTVNSNFYLSNGEHLLPTSHHEQNLIFFIAAIFISHK